eukprot:3176467-Prorocentrum_lima.AAC.1
MEEVDPHALDVEQRAFIQDLTEQFDSAMLPLTTPPGKLSRVLSSGHAGVGERRTRPPTPTQ